MIEVGLVIRTQHSFIFVTAITVSGGRYTHIHFKEVLFGGHNIIPFGSRELSEFITTYGQGTICGPFTSCNLIEYLRR